MKLFWKVIFVATLSMGFVKHGATLAMQPVTRIISPVIRTTVPALKNYYPDYDPLFVMLQLWFHA
jgi:hypothetical protein